MISKAKESIQLNASNSEIYQKLHDTFMEMDPAPNVSVLIYAYLNKNRHASNFFMIVLSFLSPYDAQKKKKKKPRIKVSLVVEGFLDPYL